MNMDFKSAKELLDLCEENQLPISEVMRQRECLLGEVPRDAVDHRMAKAWEIMHASATQPLKKPIKSMGGLIGGEAKKLETHYNKKKNICGDVLQKAMTYAMAVLEVNASMGLIVAAPTAGSAGVVPGMMLALQECYRISDQRIVDALFNAGAVGYLAMRNATVAGAVGGCQAEVGIASAMAASAAVELMGGNPQQCLDAASTVLMNMLGLVCDPVGGLVEYPCQNRNAAGVANALIAAELSLSGIRQLIPFDQMLDAMYAVGKRLPAELRETALGGCAATPAHQLRLGGLARPPRRLCRLRPVQRELIFQHAAPPVWKRPAAFLRVRDRKCRPKRRGFASFCANTPKRWPG